MERWVTNPEGANGAGLEHHDFVRLDCPLLPMKSQRPVTTSSPSFSTMRKPR